MIILDEFNKPFLFGVKNSAKAQSNPTVLSKVTENTDHRQTQTLSKNLFFLIQGVSKHGDLMNIGKVIFHVKM